MRTSIYLSLTALLAGCWCRPTFDDWHQFAQCDQSTVAIPVANATTILLSIPPFPNGYAATSFFNALTQRDGDPTQLISGLKNIGDTFDISVEYCTPGPQATTLQILTHGLGFDKSYWSFEPPVPRNTSYNYITAALSAGYATLSYDRLGTGSSSKPDPYTVIQAPVELSILVTLTTLARTGSLHPKISTPKKIVHVGHSYGSALTNALAALAPSLSDGIVLTSYSNNDTWQPLFLASNAGHLASENQPARFGNYSTGFVTWGDKYHNQYSFLEYPYFDPAVLEYAEANKWPYTIGEAISMTAIPAAAPDYTGPVLYLAAQRDLIFCGSDCSGVVDGPYSTSPGLFPNASSFDAYIQPNVGHGLNLHYNATGAYKVLLNWVKEHVR